MNTSEYIEQQRKNYALYILSSRSIPSITDGLKSGARRLMWQARNGQKVKSATLVGLTMPLHPHGDSSLETAINTLAAPYGNNYPLLDGIGAFGTRLVPNAYGAARYTSVKPSEFAKEAFYVDLELLPMKMNYDNTLEEPEHFLPLVPMFLLNPVEGIAIGFSCDIFPRALDDVIETQLKILEGKGQRNEPQITFTPFHSVSKGKNDLGKWIFEGEFKISDSATVHVTNLPFGLSYDQFISLLNKLYEQQKIVDFTDKSRDNINIEVKFKRGELLRSDANEFVRDLLKLQIALTENFNLIDFDGKSVISPSYFDVVKMFTEWRLSFYKKRFELMAKNLTIDIEKLQDLLIAIKHNAGGEAVKKKGRTEFKEYLATLKIKHLDYIASLPVYRFTKEEKEKTEKELKESLETLDSYNQIIKNKELQVDVYKQELKKLRKQFVTA